MSKKAHPKSQSKRPVSSYLQNNDNGNQASSNYFERLAVLEKIAKAYKPHGAQKAGQEFVDFIKVFYHPESMIELAHVEPKRAVDIAWNMWELIQKRDHNEAHIRVYNPKIRGGAPDGSGYDHVVLIEIACRHMPFVSSSILAVSQRLDLTLHHVVSPVFKTRRDDSGRLLSVHARENMAPDLHAEQVISVQVDRNLDDLTVAEIEDEISDLIAEVSQVVSDWPSMLGQVADTISAYEALPDKVIGAERKQESIAFLDFLRKDHFTFMGYREFKVAKKGRKKSKASKPAKSLKDIEAQFNLSYIPNSGIGLMRDEEYLLFEGIRYETLSEPVQDNMTNKVPFFVVKANHKAHLHRQVYMDVVVVKLFDKKGNVDRLCFFAGLFTARCYARATDRIPYIRRKVERVFNEAGIEPQSHTGRTLQHVLDTYPRDELFQIDHYDLMRTAIGILRLRTYPDVTVFIRADSFYRFYSCIVFIPRERLSTELRQRIGRILSRTFDGEILNFQVQADDNPLVRIQFMISNPSHRAQKFDEENVRKEIYQLTQSWYDHVMGAAMERNWVTPERKAYIPLLSQFPASYRDKTSAEETLLDLETAISIWEGEISKTQVRLVFGERRSKNLKRGIKHLDARLRLFNLAETVPLSKIMPLLDNMGVTVDTERPYYLQNPKASDVVWLHDFSGSLRAVHDGATSILHIADNLEECLLRAYREDIDNDGFNGVVACGLTWHDALIFRAVARFLQLGGYVFPQTVLAESLQHYPMVSYGLALFFKAGHHPELGCVKAKIPSWVQSLREDDSTIKSITEKTLRTMKRAELQDVIGNYIVDRLRVVENLDEERCLRAIWDIFGATVRTNAFITEDNGQLPTTIAFKLHSQKIETLPHPRPEREIYIYGRRFESVHLRAGEIARGGIRWSDRYQDFRTEILGLVKAQMVKNAVIVPMGSKGGFIPKNIPNLESWDDKRAEAIACYQEMMRMMLALTDNWQEGKIVPAPDIIRLDNDDPYLVVAADKGTATFSDIANDISVNHGYWLGDAFASGGSIGYDHKEMGITARGAWEAVKRHFRELGHDTQSQPFTVVGVGDMSGDVFGNGMLCSDQIRLVAAFDHRHIFIDPDPDTAKSFKERKRLYTQKGGSSWDDYNRKVMSKGAMVVNRREKKVTLTAEVAALLSLSKNTSLTPYELMRHLLRLQVDLLWFGGIGTYIKSSNETHAEVGDPANNDLRIDARDVRARVIGEGANLGVTQLARIEYSQQGADGKGGRINTDFVDNAAGVDTSDHEVNLKILLSQIREKKGLPEKTRRKLLADMTDEVAQRVLGNVYDQTLALTLEHKKGADVLPHQLGLIHLLESDVGLDRRVEFLPDDEALMERLDTGKGLTRPELAVLLSYEKNRVTTELAKIDLSKIPQARALLENYFPDQALQKAGKLYTSHRLANQIMAMRLANESLNCMGSYFYARKSNRTETSVFDVAVAFLTARSVFQTQEIWQEIHKLDQELDSVDKDLQGDLYGYVVALMRQSCKWLLVNESQIASRVDEVMTTYTTPLQSLLPMVDKLVMFPERITERINLLLARGTDETLARRVAVMPAIIKIWDAVSLAQRHKMAPALAARLVYRVHAHFRVDDLVSGLENQSISTTWARESRDVLIDQLHTVIQQVIGDLCQSIKKKAPKSPVEKLSAQEISKIVAFADEAFDAWRQSHLSDIKDLEVILSRADNAMNADSDVVTIVVNRLGRLVG